MKTDELIKKISDFNVELLGIINYLDENSIIYGIGQLQALQEDMQVLLESELAEMGKGENLGMSKCCNHPI